MVALCLISPDFATCFLALHKHMVNDVVKWLSTFGSPARSTSTRMFLRSIPVSIQKSTYFRNEIEPLVQFFHINPLWSLTTRQREGSNPTICPFFLFFCRQKINQSTFFANINIDPSYDMGFLRHTGGADSGQINLFILMQPLVSFVFSLLLGKRSESYSHKDTSK